MTTELVRQDDVSSEQMTPKEAEAAVERIKRGADNLRRQLVEFNERRGWRSLGYKSMDACAKSEFGMSRQHIYRQLGAARVQENLSPIGDNRNADDVPESVLRPLAGRSPEVQRQAFAEASANGAPTAEKVRQAVERIEQPEPLPQSVIPPSVSAVPTQTVTMGNTPAVTQSEPKKITPSAPALDLGEIDLAVLRDAGITIGQAVGAVARIASVARQGGLSWEKRVDVACRLNVK